MKSDLIEELAREVGELLSELKELKEELSIVKQERDILYEQYDEMMKLNGEEIAELKKQLEAAGREHFADVGKMPEGVEWPRFEDGEPVGFGDLYVNANGNRSEVQYIGFKPDGYKVNKGQKRNKLKAYGEPVKRPDPEVLDADGVPIKVGDAAYSNGGLFANEFVVEGFDPAMRVIAKCPTFNESMIATGDKFTHRKPDTQEAIDADMTMPPWEYCVRHNLERDDRHLDDDNYIEPMVKHLLERQRNLLIGGECNG